MGLERTQHHSAWIRGTTRKEISTGLRRHVRAAHRKLFYGAELGVVALWTYCSRTCDPSQSPTTGAPDLFALIGRFPAEPIASIALHALSTQGPQSTSFASYADWSLSILRSSEYGEDYRRGVAYWLGHIAKSREGYHVSERAVGLLGENLMSAEIGDACFAGLLAFGQKGREEIVRRIRFVQGNAEALVPKVEVLSHSQNVSPEMRLALGDLLTAIEKEIAALERLRRATAVLSK